MSKGFDTICPVCKKRAVVTYKGILRFHSVECRNTDPNAKED
jgi:hypothetical protein